MNHKKQLKQNRRFSGILLFFTAILTFLFILICFYFIQYHKIQNNNQIKTVGTTKHPCRVILAISYDKEPIDVTLVSPSGEEYREEYDAKRENNTIFISTITREKGDWIAKYNQKRNHNLHIRFEEKITENLLLEDVVWNTDDKKPSVTFNGYLGGKTGVLFDYDIIATSNKTDFSGIICEGNSKTGMKTTAVFNTENMKKSDDWQAVLNIYITKKDKITQSDMIKSKTFAYKPPKTKKKQKGHKNGKSKNRNP